MTKTSDMVKMFFKSQKESQTTIHALSFAFSASTSSAEEPPDMSIADMAKSMEEARKLLPKGPIYRVMVLNPIDRGKMAQTIKAESKECEVSMYAPHRSLFGIELIPFNLMPEGTSYAFEDPQDAFEFIDLVEYKVKRYKIKPETAILLSLVELKEMGMENGKLQIKEKQEVQNRKD